MQWWEEITTHLRRDRPESGFVRDVGGRRCAFARNYAERRPMGGMRLVAALYLLLTVASCLSCTGTAPLAPQAVALNHAGTEALAQGNLETAEARFALALEFHPRFVEALTNLGTVEMQRGNLTRAKLLFERARRINADLAQPHHALGVVAERQRRPDVASDHYRDALRVNPGFGPSRANLGRMLFAAGRYDEAREQFARLVEVEPALLAGRTGLAETLLQLGRTDDSDAVLDRARADFGEAPEIVLLEARRRLRRGDIASAEAMLLPLRSGQDDTARAAWSWLAAARLARADPHGALDAAEKALSFDRNDAVATFVVAMTLADANDPRAGAWTLRAHRLAPRNPILAAEIARAPHRAKDR
jgi:tetratricopeptide (TPR) repeat protein